MVRRVRWLRAGVSAHPGIAVVIVAALPRLLVVLAGVHNRAVLVSTDSNEYLALADHPSSYWVSTAPDWPLGLLRPPGYPFMLAVPRALSDGLVAVSCVQAAVSVAAAWLTWKVGCELVGRRVGIIAGLWVALDPTMVVQSGRLLPEAPFAVCLLLTVLLAHRALCRSSARLGALAGLALATATFVRPVSLYLPLVACFVALLGAAVAHLRGVPPARTLPAVLALVLAFAVPVGAWIAHIQVMTDVPTFSTIEGINLLEFRAAGAVAAEDGTSFSSERRRLQAEVETRLEPGMNPAEIARERRALGLEVLSEHPVGAVRMAARGLVRMLVGPGGDSMSSVTQDLPAGALVEGGLTGLGFFSAASMVVAAAVGGLVLARRGDTLALVVIFVPIAYLLVVSAGPDAYSRFRVPLIPLLAILAASAVAEWPGRQARAPAHD